MFHEEGLLKLLRWANSRGPFAPKKSVQEWQEQVFLLIYQRWWIANPSVYLSELLVGVELEMFLVASQIDKIRHFLWKLVLLAVVRHIDYIRLIRQFVCQAWIIQIQNWDKNISQNNCETFRHLLLNFLFLTYNFFQHNL